MNKEDNKRIYGREELKEYFKNGHIPSEKHFAYLIESMINKQDDGISKDETCGLHIFKPEFSRRLITFFNHINENDPFFLVEKDDKEIPSLKFQPLGETEKEEEEEESSFFFHDGGRLGIGKRCAPPCKMEVRGFIGMEGRTGIYKTGQVPADGAWHSIIRDLDNCQAFEIMARAGAKGKGKFALLHAIALSTYGRSRSRIRKTRAHYGFFWNKLNIRWKSDHTHKYHLQIRTYSNYGDQTPLYYSVTKLWDDEAMLPGRSFYSNNK